MNNVYRVMIVDDEPIVRDAITSLIPWPKHHIEIVKTAAHAVEALDYLQNHDVDLMLVDIRLPVIDGLELIRRAQQIKQDMEFIIISGHSDFAYAQQAMRLSVRDYILKPVNESSLLTAITASRDAWEQKQFVQNLQRSNLDIALPPSRRPQRFSPTVSRMIDIVEAEITNEELSLKWISAKKMFLNENYLSRLFQKELKQRFSSYLLERRMLLAMRLMLHDPDIKIQTIAQETGFGDNAQYFSIAFKKYTGYTPTEYRKRLLSPTN